MRLHSKRLALLTVPLLVTAVTVVILCRQKAPSLRLPYSSVIRLEGYAFERRTIRYELPNRPLARRIEKVLLSWATKNVDWFSRRGVTTVITPQFAHEPVLSAAFSMHDSSG